MESLGLALEDADVADAAAGMTTRRSSCIITLFDTSTEKASDCTAASIIRTGFLRVFFEFEPSSSVLLLQNDGDPVGFNLPYTHTAS